LSVVTLFTNASQILTCDSARSDERTVHEQKALAIDNGSVLEIADQAKLRAAHPSANVVDCTGCVITPGLVDSHTHAVFGDWRAAEYELRSRGLPYMDIAKRGGGINASVRSVRERSEDQLFELALPRVTQFLQYGITTVEIKSGYGLSTDAELKQLRVIDRLKRELPIHIVPTFMGAHEFPLEYRERRADYVQLLIDEMIPAVAEAKLATFCDVFMEPGVFDANQTRRILEVARKHGLFPKLHADELENSGGAELAAEIGAASADHLGAVSEQGIAALANSETVATLLPATLFFLGKPSFAPARALIDGGATVALATDFNPGTAPSANLPLVLTFACSRMRMTPLEAICAATFGGALALRLSDGRGSLRPGGVGDLVIWSVADYREIPYRFGSTPVREVWCSGKRCFGGL
jgi:imidazolonepropionase